MNRLLILTCAGLVAACSTSVGNLDRSKLASLRPGETTADQAIALMGPPAYAVTQPDGAKILTYEEAHTANSLTFWVPLYDFVGGYTDYVHTIATLDFDKDGKLTGTKVADNTLRITPWPTQPAVVVAPAPAK